MVIIIFTTAEPVASGFVDVSAGSHPLSAPVEVAKSTSSQSKHQGTASFTSSYIIINCLMVIIIFTTAEPVASGFVDVSAGSHPLTAPVEVAKSTSSQSENQVCIFTSSCIMFDGNNYLYHS